MTVIVPIEFVLEVTATDRFNYSKAWHKASAQ